MSERSKTLQCFRPTQLCSLSPITFLLLSIVAPARRLFVRSYFSIAAPAQRICVRSFFSITAPSCCCCTAVSPAAPMLHRSNRFGEKLVQRMPSCRRGYIHVINNVYSRWEMYAIKGAGTGQSTVKETGTQLRQILMPRRYIIFLKFSSNQLKSDDFSGEYLMEKVTKRVKTAPEHWKGWNWRSEGDILVGFQRLQLGKSVWYMNNLFLCRKD